MSDGRFSLRLARPEELRAILGIDDAASALYRDAGLELGLAPDHPFVLAESARWAQAIENGRAHVAVNADDQILGFMTLGLVDGAPYLDQLAVHPRAMRRGIGAALIGEAIRWSASRPLWLTTYAHLPWNQPYYERHGFVAVPEGECGPELRAILEDQRRTLPQPDQRVALVRGGGERLAELERLSARTLAHYERHARDFQRGTWDHDVSQNYAALLEAIESPPPFTVLDFGCGPGRDLAYFKALGHEAVGLDGAQRFVEMAREITGCEVLHQDFLHLELPLARFDGVFANASLFHVPAPAIDRVLRALHATLKESGVLFASNPWGNDVESRAGEERYGAFYSPETWRTLVTRAGFRELGHYYRPAGKPRTEQPWLATLWRKV